ncbi:hypothetical protein [Micromonospora sp. IBHARD004]|uniref:hypothetical protein n=1 Tax=Micromonospora sp. IBHARD004 TaxID=3457764 RepID=UPI004059339E
MSSDADPPSSPRPADLADLLAPLYADLLRREPSAHSALLRRAVKPFRAYDLAVALTPLFAARFVQQTEGDDDRVLVGELHDDRAAADHITRATFADRVAAVLADFPEPPADASWVAFHGARDVRALAAHGGRSSWVRKVADLIAGRLPSLGDLDPPPALIRAGSTTSAQSEEERAERRRAYMRDHNRAARADDRAGRRDDMILAAQACMAWRDRAAPGPHPAGELHGWYATAAANTPGHNPLGRTTFYRIADEAIGPRKRRASGPVYVVPQEVTPMNREQSRELAALIVDRLTDEWRAAALDGLADLVAERQAVREPAAPRHDDAQVLPFMRRVG